VSNLAAWVIDGLGDVLEQDTPVQNLSKPDSGWTLVAGAASLAHQPANQPPPAGGSQIAAIDLNSGVIAVIIGTGGLISRTVDKGTTWLPINSNTTADLVAISIVSDGPMTCLGWAVG
jgi:hypothetical protein